MAAGTTTLPSRSTRQPSRQLHLVPAEAVSVHRGIIAYVLVLVYKRVCSNTAIGYTMEEASTADSQYAWQ
jgi:hypothetical protein